jgi:hypothetical protein
MVRHCDRPNSREPHLLWHPCGPSRCRLCPKRREQLRLKSIRLRLAIGQVLKDRGITPTVIGTVLGMPAQEAIKLLNRHQWREGDVVLLEAAAARLGVLVPEPPNNPWNWLTEIPKR